MRTLTFVKTMAVFSTVCHVLLYTAIVYQMPHIFPALRGQCKKLNHGTFARLNPRHVRGLGAWLKIVSEYDQEIPQSQTADNPMAPRGRAAQPSRDTRKTN